MSKYRKGPLYARRMKSSDKGDTLTTATLMAAKLWEGRMIGKKRPPFVLVREGMRDSRVIHVANTRRELQGSILVRTLYF